MIHYKIPSDWIRFQLNQVLNELVLAKSAILSLRNLPYQKSWVLDLQQMELKREIAGTSKIEGADFTENEFDAALRDSPEELITRSQRQVHAAMQTYNWISHLPDDRPLDENLIKDIHRRIVFKADDDHCVAGKIRHQNDNVNFGQPRHRGAEGGNECKVALSGLVQAINTEYKKYDPLIQALATHYHLAAMHPFLDGNGRTARAVEALLLQRAGLRDICFIAMSNYYYDEKINYLKSLSEVRAADYDLTSFIKFGLTGIEIQSRRVLNEIQVHVSKAVYSNLMFDLFKKLKTSKQRIVSFRQIEILKFLLEKNRVDLGQIFDKLYNHVYKDLKNPEKAIIRDLNSLIVLGAINYKRTNDNRMFSPRLEWPMEITHSEFFELIKKMPKAKTPVSF